jgi:hypothetical protein
MKKQEVSKKDESVVASLILAGDLSKMPPEDKVRYYNGYCERLGLDPFTKPFDLLRLSGKEILYCTRSGAQQLNKLHNVSHAITSRTVIPDAGVYEVTARACLPDGRCTESIGAVSIINLKGEAYANAVMKAETKAKRRATLDLLGLGVLDETEAESIMPKQQTQQPQLKVNVQTEEQVLSVTAEEVDDAEEMDWTAKYDDVTSLLIAIYSTETIQQLNAVYVNNHDLVEREKLRNKFTEQKNRIQNEQ